MISRKSSKRKQYHYRTRQGNSDSHLYFAKTIYFLLFFEAKRCWSWIKSHGCFIPVNIRPCVYTLFLSIRTSSELDPSIHPKDIVFDMSECQFQESHYECNNFQQDCNYDFGKIGFSIDLKTNQPTNQPKKQTNKTNKCTKQNKTKQVKAHNSKLSLSLQ